MLPRTVLLLAIVMTKVNRMRSQSSSAQPNIVIFIADDLGVNDLSCYGNTSYRTPNIDRLAAEGALLTHHLSGAAMSSASRGALLTGRYPVRYGLQQSRNGPPTVSNVFGRDGLPQTEKTFAKLLQDAGYRTKYVGKWHLGWSCESWEDQCHGPLGHGFDEFYGTVLGEIGFKWPGGGPKKISDFFKQNVMTELFCERDDTKYFTGQSSNSRSGRQRSGPRGRRRPNVLQSVLRSRQQTCSRETAVQQWQRWLEFVRQQKFSIMTPEMFDFTYRLLIRDLTIEKWPYSLPGLSETLTDHSVEYIHTAARGDSPFLLVHGFMHPHVPLFVAPQFRGVSGHSRYADNVIELDWCVGEVMRALDDAGVADNTIVHFVSNQGAFLEALGQDGQREGGSNYPFRGGKFQGGTEGGISVPSIFRWPARIPAGRVVDVPTSSMDLLPTLLEAAGISSGQLELDGASIQQLLTGGTDASPHRYMFHYCASDIHAVRYIPDDEPAVYKLYLKTPNYSDPQRQRCDWLWCRCYGSDITDLDVPRMFDIHNDPSEMNAIPETDQRYRKHALHMLVALARQQRRRIGIESQYEQFDLHMMNPAVLPWDQLHKFAGLRREQEGVTLPAEV